MLASAQKYNVPIVKLWASEEGSNSIKDFEDFMKKIKSEKGIEGCVVRFADGNMYKVKTEWYFAQVR
jgi:hypothetical protein